MSLYIKYKIGNIHFLVLVLKKSKSRRGGSMSFLPEGERLGFELLKKG